MSKVVFGCIVPHPPIIIPEIGRARSSEVAATQAGMRTIAEKLEASKPDVIVIISPHGETKPDAMGVAVAPTTIGSFLPWGVQGLEYFFENDSTFVNALKEEAGKAGVPLAEMGERGYTLDHGVLVPMYFLSDALKGATLVPVTFSWLPANFHFAFGKAIASAATRTNKRTAIIASGDLSHRLSPMAPAGYHPLGKEFDRKLIEDVGKHDVSAIMNMDTDLLDAAGECGYRSIVILLGALDSLVVTPKVLSYEGPFGVGYLVASYEIDTEKTKEAAASRSSLSDVHPLVLLAKSAVESYVRNGEVMTMPSFLPKELQERRGVFVCLKDKRGYLRGCIGTFEPVQTNIAEETIINAISSATKDPRFYAVGEHELSGLTYTVDVLGHTEPIAGIEGLDPKKYGVIVQKGFRKGLLLPDLEGVDSALDQVNIAKEKAGIHESETVDLFRFEVIRYTE